MTLDSKNFTKIPPEVKFQCYEYLPKEDLARLSQTNRTSRNVVSAIWGKKLKQLENGCGEFDIKKYHRLLKTMRQIPHPFSLIFIGQETDGTYAIKLHPRMTTIEGDSSLEKGERYRAWLKENSTGLNQHYQAITDLSSGKKFLFDFDEDFITEEMYLAAIKQNWEAVLSVPKVLLTEDICLTAIEQNFEIIDYINDQDLLTEAMCLTALKQSWKAIAYIPEALLTEAMCLTALKENKNAISYIPQALLTEAMCLKAIHWNWKYIEILPVELLTEAVCIAALKQNTMAFFSIPRQSVTQAIRSMVNIHQPSDRLLEAEGRRYNKLSR